MLKSCFLLDLWKLERPGRTKCYSLLQFYLLFSYVPVLTVLTRIIRWASAKHDLWKWKKCKVRETANHNFLSRTFLFLTWFPKCFARNVFCKKDNIARTSCSLIRWLLLTHNAICSVLLTWFRYVVVVVVTPLLKQMSGQQTTPATPTTTRCTLRTCRLSCTWST